MVTGIGFDFDGVLSDYSYRYHKTYEHVLKRVNLPCPSRELLIEVRRKYGLNQTDMFDQFLVPKKIPNRKEIIEKCSKRRLDILELSEYLKLDRLYEGALEKIRELYGRRFLTGLITKRKNPDIFFEFLGKNAQLFDFIRVIQNQDKQDAIREFVLRYKINKCYFVSDTCNDVIDGNNAGVITVGVLSGLDSKKRLRKAGCCNIIKNINDICRVFDENEC